MYDQLVVSASALGVWELPCLVSVNCIYGGIDCYEDVFLLYNGGLYGFFCGFCVLWSKGFGGAVGLGGLQSLSLDAHVPLLGFF